MHNRRTFLKLLGIGTASVYLRLAPEKLATVPRVIETPPSSIFIDEGKIWEFPVSGSYYTRGRLDFTDEKFPTYVEYNLDEL